MKKEAQTKKHHLWRDVVDWLKLAIKVLRKKLSLKNKSVESFPNEAPH